MTDEEPSEYTCPECGSAFTEGAERCPVCDTVFDWAEETDYVCPECGARVPHDSKSCPECGAVFVAEGEVHDKGIDAMLEAAVAETIVTPKREVPPSEWEEQSPEGIAAPEGAESVAPPEAGGAEVTPEPSAAVQGLAAPAEAGTKAHDERALPAKSAKPATPAKPAKPAKPATPATSATPAKPAAPVPEGASPGAKAKVRTARRFPGGFTWVGLVFIILAGIALAMTVIALRWDTISSGSKYETIGAMQSMVIATGIAAFVVCAFVSMWDLLRGPRPADR